MNGLRPIADVLASEAVLVANPGALFRANPKTCVVLDVLTGELRPIILPVTKTGDSAHPSGSMSGHQPNFPDEPPGLPPRL